MVFGKRHLQLICKTIYKSYNLIKNKPIIADDIRVQEVVDD